MHVYPYRYAMPLVVRVSDQAAMVLRNLTACSACWGAVCRGIYVALNVHNEARQNVMDIILRTFVKDLIYL